MKYTLLANRQGKGGWGTSKMISITKWNICFTSNFRDKYGIKRFITFYQDEDGFLCFKLSDEDSFESFKISTNKNAGSFIRKPTFLRDNIKDGKYNVIERDGYFVTGCKLNLE